MKGIRIHSPGDAGRLRFEDLPDPVVEPGRCLVAVAFAGVNFIDIYQRTGLYPVPLPFTPGLEGSGHVIAVGPQVSDFSVGDRVAWAGHGGSYAQAASLHSSQLVPIPDAVDFQTAAAVMLQGMTAHYLCRSTFPVRPGHVALVHAGAGGVGLLLTQLVTRMGGEVIATVSTPEKARLSRAAGAREVIIYAQEDFATRLRELHPAGVDVVYDSVGKTTFAGSINCLKPRGMMVSFGNSSGPVDPVSPLLLTQKGSIYLTRPKLADYTATRSELLERAGDILDLVASRALSVRIEHVLPLSLASRAHLSLESRATTGKIILDTAR